MAYLDLKNVSKSFAGTLAVKDFNLEIEKGRGFRRCARYRHGFSVLCALS